MVWVTAFAQKGEVAAALACFSRLESNMSGSESLQSGSVTNAAVRKL